MPPSFHDIPVLGTEEEIAEQLWELVCEVLASEGDDVRAQIDGCRFRTSSSCSHSN
ncbi:hypothetical protein [Kitasatospora sp. NPDC057500]|uniref:hypothetical protein n=1 Tax=Kitasatospora sp. NPDC057500 TaxID=3346151 RepID=UPI0036A8326F